MLGCTDASDCYGGECLEVASGRMACTRPPRVEEHDFCYDYPGDTDECGCPGRSCPQGQICRTREAEVGAGAGAPAFVNECGRDECSSNEDCTATAVCQQVWLSVTPYEAFSRCVPSACVNDAECEGCGQCTPRFRFGDQGAKVYEGLACCSAPYTGIDPAPTHSDAAPPDAALPDAGDAGCEDTPIGQDGGITPSDPCLSCLADRCPETVEACGSTCFEMVKCAYHCMTMECIDACKVASPCTWPTAEAILYCMEPCDCPLLSSFDDPY